jgi:L-2-hydroxyglutarate oxidase LhgO
MKFKFTIIGAGVVGLAIAERIAREFQGDADVLVVEKEHSYGRGCSSRNSEVIHSGIYYPTASLKHKLCVKGRRMLYDYLTKKQIPYDRCGKLIIATGTDELDALERLSQQAEENGIENVAKLTKDQVLKLEPDINVTAALLSKETGIFDTHSFMKSLVSAIGNKCGTILYSNEVVSLDYDYDADAYSLSLSDGTSFSSEYVINSGGLFATQISKFLGIEPVRLYPCKGDYFSYIGVHRCRHLIYPVPHKSLTGLGVHATIDLNGRLKFGPDAEYIDNIADYTVSADKREHFFQSAKKIFKDIKYDELSPDMAGIRPKIQGPNDNDVKDFYIKDEAENGFNKFINLLGIESPGLTASLAIGEYVFNLIEH